MVAQHTICFNWLVPEPLIKHRVSDTFIPDKPISRQGFVLNNSDVNLAPTPQLCTPGLSFASPQGVGGGSKDVHGAINWILKVTLMILILIDETNTYRDTRTHTIHRALCILHKLKVSAWQQRKQRVRVLCSVEYLSEVCDGWSLGVVLTSAIKEGEVGRRDKMKAEEGEMQCERGENVQREQ